MSTFKLKELEQFSKYITLTIDETDDNVRCSFVIFKDSDDESLWRLAFENIDLFLEWVTANKVKYHFLFDVHECAVLPVTRAHQVQQHLQQRTKVLREHLHSTVVIVRDPLAEVVLNGCFALFPPTRPIKVLCQTCAGPLTDVCTQHVEKFFRKRKLDQTAGTS